MMTNNVDFYKKFKHKKTVDLGSTAKTFIAHKTKLDEYRTFSTLTING
jgi:hypothetical protein